MDSIEIKPFLTKANSIVELDIPSSKSLSIRALILASIAEGNSIIRNVLKSDDTVNCINALKDLGIEIKNNGNDFETMGCGGVLPIAKDKIYFGSSGITSRFLLAIICASLSSDKEYHEIILDGSEQLRKRTIKPLVDALKAMGADIIYIEKEGFFPLLVRSARLNNIDNIEVSGALSSQYVSAILMMSPLLNRNIKVHVKDIKSSEHPYVKMAIKTMEDFGIDEINEISENVYEIFPQRYRAMDFAVETDLNTANYFFALIAALGGRIRIRNVDRFSLQPGLKFLEVLKKMGCEIIFEDDSVILNGPKKLKGGFRIDMFHMAEMATLLAVLAVFADLPIEIYGVKHIRNHESDRISAISRELKKANIIVEEFEDGLKVFPGNPEFIEADSYDDHRIAMSLAVLGAAGNGIKILNPGCVSKTCPEFFELFNISIEKLKMKS